MSYPFTKITKKTILIKALEADERKRLPKLTFVYPFPNIQYKRWANK